MPSICPSPNRLSRPSIRAMRCGQARLHEAVYQRDRDLPRLIPMLEEDLLTPNPAAHRRLVQLLRRALRAERARANNRHWAYSPSRHAALLRATRTEMSRLNEGKRRPQARPRARE